MRKFRVDVHLKSGKVLKCTASNVESFRELSLEYAEAKALTFIQDGITVKTENIDYLEYMYEVS